MAARRRRLTGRIIALTLLCLALFVYLWFEGRLDLRGSRSGDGAGSGRTAAGMPAAHDAPSDLTAGRRARLDFLRSSGRLREAADLARGMRDAGQDASERAFGRAQLAPDGPLAKAATGRLAARLAAKDWGAARESLTLIAAVFGKAKALALVPDLESEGLAPREYHKLTDLLGAVLPVRLDAKQQIFKLRAGACVIRVANDAGGFRFRTLAWSDLDPIALRAGLAAAFGAAQDDCDHVVTWIARDLAATAHPVLAYVVRTGKLRLPD